MKIKRIVVLLLLLAVVVGLVIAVPQLTAPMRSYGFARGVSDAEAALRMELVDTALQWLGTQEGSAEHGQILDIYNTHTPLAQGYEVQPEDNWCATFVSAVAIQCELTDIIPTECGCQRQIGLWQQLGRWEEADDYVPLPGDIIYYCFSDNSPVGDCTGWSDHVGIVAGTSGNYMKVIEGNSGDQVAVRYVRVDAVDIRGYGLPDYGAAG